MSTVPCTARMQDGERQKLDAQTHRGQQVGVNRPTYSLKLFTAVRLCV